MPQRAVIIRARRYSKIVGVEAAVHALADVMEDKSTAKAVLVGQLSDLHAHVPLIRAALL